MRRSRKDTGGPTRRRRARTDGPSASSTSTAPAGTSVLGLRGTSGDNVPSKSVQMPLRPGSVANGPSRNPGTLPSDVVVVLAEHDDDVRLGGLGNDSLGRRGHHRHVAEAERGLGRVGIGLVPSRKKRPVASTSCDAFLTGRTWKPASVSFCELSEPMPTMPTRHVHDDDLHLLGVVRLGVVVPSFVLVGTVLVGVVVVGLVVWVVVVGPAPPASADPKMPPSLRRASATPISTANQDDDRPTDGGLLARTPRRGHGRVPMPMTNVSRAVSVNDGSAAARAVNRASTPSA